MEAGHIKASVIIPTYRHWDQLRTCLAALTRQTVPSEEFEIIVVNNDPDHAPPADFDLPPNAQIFDEPKKGSYAARNTGIDAARSTTLCFTDSDCIPAPDWLENALAAMRGKDLNRIGGRIEGFAPDGVEPVVLAFERIFSFPQVKYVEEGQWAATANMMAQKAAFEEVGSFADWLLSNGDKEWGERAAAANIPITYCDDVIVRHPCRPTRSALLQKRRRTAGGAAVRAIKAKGRMPALSRLLLRTPRQLLPPFGAAKAMFADQETTFWLKVRVYLLVYRIQLTILWEEYRIIVFNKEPERR